MSAPRATSDPYPGAVDPLRLPALAVPGAALLLALAVGGAAPTGAALVDALWVGGLVVAVTLAARLVPRWVVWLATVALAAAVGTGAGAGGLLLATLGFALAAGAAWLEAGRRAGHRAGAARAPMVASAGAAASVLALLVLPDVGPFGATACVAAIGIVPVLVLARRLLEGRARRRVNVVLGALAAVVGLATIGALVAAGLAARPLLSGAAGATDARAAAQDGDVAGASARLATAEADLRAARRPLHGWWTAPALAVPGVAQNLRALRAVTDQSLAVVGTRSLIDSVGDYRQLKYRSGRIDLAKVRAITPAIARTAGVLRRSSTGIGAIDRSWLLPPFGARVRHLDADLGDTASEATTATSVLRLLPDLLGGNGPRRWFVAFENPAEARGLGGFLGNYAELTATDGKVRLTRSGAISELERPPGTRHLLGPEEYLDRYGRFDPADYFRDATFSPSLPLDAQVIRQLYPQSGGRPIDGVIAMDPYTLAQLLRITGPIRVPGYPRLLTAANLPDVTLRQQYAEFATDNRARKDVLVDATKIAFDRLLDGDLPAPRRLVDLLGPMVRQRRLLLWSSERAEERLFAQLHADGTVARPAGGDALLVFHQNYGNSKIDAYLDRRLTYDVHVDHATGRVTATATLLLRNTAPASGLPRYVIGNARGKPFGTNLMNLTVLTALQVTDVHVDGTRLRPVREAEAGLGAYDVAVDLPAGATARLVVRLRGGVDLRRSPYRLSLEPRSSVRPMQVEVRVDGRPAVRCGSDDQAPDVLHEAVVVGEPGCRSDG